MVAKSLLTIFHLTLDELTLSRVKIMDLNFFLIFWLFFIACMTLVAFVSRIKAFTWINEFFVYGKEKTLHDLETKDQKKSSLLNFLVNNLQVPKRWFVHFYLFGFLSQTIILACYLTGDREVFNTLVYWNGMIFGSKSFEFLGSVSRLQIYLGFAFIHFQLIRRCYENMSVSIFSTSNIHLLHYLTGYLFYGSIVLLQFNLIFRNKKETVPIDYPSLLVGSLVYVSGYVIQHISIRQLANLRSPNKVDTLEQHYMPRDFMFEYVSCPHYFGEVLIYLGVWIELNMYINAFIIFVWTFMIHIQMAFQSHNWYHKKFGSDYPKNRKALLPFLL